MAMSIGDCMDGLGAALAVIDGLNVYDYPADAVSVPAAVVLFPEELTYDSTMDRGLDRATFQVIVMVGRMSDHSARDALALYLDGTGVSSVKVAIDGSKTLGGAAHSSRVMSAVVENYTVGGVDLLGARFSIDVIA